MGPSYSSSNIDITTSFYDADDSFEEDSDYRDCVDTFELPTQDIKHRRVAPKDSTSSSRALSKSRHSALHDHLVIPIDQLSYSTVCLFWRCSFHRFYPESFGMHYYLLLCCFESTGSGRLLPQRPRTCVKFIMTLFCLDFRVYIPCDDDGDCQVGVCGIMCYDKEIER